MDAHSPVSEDQLTLYIPSISSDRSSKISYLSDDSYYFDDEYPPLMDFDACHSAFMHSPRPDDMLFVHPFIGYHNQFLLQADRCGFGDLSPIQELPELIYEAVKLMNFDQCMAVEKRRIRTIRYKKINRKVPADIGCGDGSSSSGISRASTLKRRTAAGGGKADSSAPKRCKKPLLKRCVKWALTCIA